MIDYERLEKFSKVMERWHDRVFPWVGRALMVCSLIVSSTALMAYYEYDDKIRENWNQQESQIIPYEMFQVLFYLGTFGIPLYIAYSTVFTKFKFPIDFRGNSRGKRTVFPHNLL
jgi:hypothetical protein